MAQVKILKNMAVIEGCSFADCKAEWDRVIAGVEKDLGERCAMRDWIFSNMIESDGRCVVTFILPNGGRCD